MDIELLAAQFFDYSQHILGYSPVTIKRYKQAIHFYCRWARVTAIDQVTEANLRTFFYEGRAKRNWQTRTFHSYHKSLLVFFRWCVKRGYLTANPIEDIEIPKLEKRLPPKLTKQQALRLLEIVYNYPYDYRFLRYRNHALFSVFIYAGLRKQEALQLRYADVDLDNFTIFVNQGKGGKDRVVPISFALAQSLKRYISERNRLGKTCPQFFTSLNRNQGFTDIGLRRLVRKIKNASGVSFSVHKLRHTFATLMLEGGCDIYALSRMMGHNDIKTTTIYLYASIEHLKSQINKHPLNNEGLTGQILLKIGDNKDEIH